VAKLVDAADSKSAGAKHRAGSSPALGTNLEKPENLVFSGFFFVIRSFCNQVSANTLILLAT
jgi:hypothetical protein